MANVSRFQTIKNDDGTSTDIYYGVEDLKYIKTTEGSLVNTLQNITTNITTLSNTVGDINNGLVAAVNKNTTALGDESVGLIATVNQLNDKIQSLASELEALTKRIDELHPVEEENPEEPII